ncbi:hypothetical protein ACLB2K_057015 [Fragaria x ananassa]
MANLDRSSCGCENHRQLHTEDVLHWIHKRRPNQVKRTCYAQSSQIRQIRRKMTEIMVSQASSCDLKDLVRKFIAESIGKEIEKQTTSIYPLQNVFIRKVKILKAPKFDLGKLMEVHGDEDVGTKVDRPAE